MNVCGLGLIKTIIKVVLVCLDKLNVALILIKQENVWMYHPACM